MRVQSTGRTLKDDLEQVWAHDPPELRSLSHSRRMAALRAAVDLGLKVLDVDTYNLHDSPLTVEIDISAHSVSISVRAKERNEPL